MFLYFFSLLGASFFALFYFFVYSKNISLNKVLFESASTIRTNLLIAILLSFNRCTSRIRKLNQKLTKILGLADIAKIKRLFIQIRRL